MTHTRDQVITAAKATFSDGDLPTVLALLDLYGIQPYEREKERVQMAILELSGGSDDKLLYLVQAAKTDYRDVLAWKELGPLSESEGEKLRNQARGVLEKWGPK